MKLPRDVSGAEAVKALGRMGFSITRQARDPIERLNRTPFEEPRKWRVAGYRTPQEAIFQDRKLGCRAELNVIL